MSTTYEKWMFEYPLPVPEDKSYQSDDDDKDDAGKKMYSLNAKASDL